MTDDDVPPPGQRMIKKARRIRGRSRDLATLKSYQSDSLHTSGNMHGPNRTQFPSANGNGPFRIHHSSAWTKALDPTTKNLPTYDLFDNTNTASFAVPCRSSSFDISTQPSTNGRPSKRNKTTQASVAKLGHGTKSSHGESIGDKFFYTASLMEQATPYTESTATSATAPSVTNANLIEMHTRYTQLPEAAQLAFLEVEQYINYQKSIFRSGGTGIDHNILHIKDQARELMQTTAILNTQLEEQNQTVTYLDIEVRQQMDATVIGKEWVGNGCAQRIFGAGNHHHYISRLYGRLQDQIEGFKLAIWHIEHHLHQQQEMTTQMLPWKLGAMITAQNDLLSSLSSQANKLHQLVQDMLLQVPINHL